MAAEREDLRPREVEPGSCQWRPYLRFNFMQVKQFR